MHFSTSHPSRPCAFLFLTTVYNSHLTNWCLSVSGGRLPPHHLDAISDVLDTLPSSSHPHHYYHSKGVNDLVDYPPPPSSSHKPHTNQHSTYASRYQSNRLSSISTSSLKNTQNLPPKPPGSSAKNDLNLDDLLGRDLRGDREGLNTSLVVDEFVTDDEDAVRGGKVGRTRRRDSLNSDCTDLILGEAEMLINTSGCYDPDLERHTGN